MIKRIIRIVLGTAFLILGVLGLFLPILQGILFLIVGLLILAPESKRIRALLGWMRGRWPKVFEAAEGIRDKFTKRKHTSDQADR
jgi:uncharacterized protein